MRRASQRSGGMGGFTLLEVMLAVMILGIIIIAIYATWSAGLNGWKRGAGVSENFQRERIVMTTLEGLTKSLTFAPSQNSIYAVNYNHGSENENSISFVTASDLLLPPSEAFAAGLRRVTIGLQRDEYGRSFLGIANVNALESDKAPPAVMHVLSAEICGFVARFRDPKDGSWKDTWDDTTLMPSAIEYTIGFGKNDGRTPPVVVTRAVELPTAEYVMQILGQAMGQDDTTNATSRQNIPLNDGVAP